MLHWQGHSIAACRAKEGDRMRRADGRGMRLEAPRRGQGIAAPHIGLALILAAAWIIPTSAAATTALLVVGSTTLNSSDTALKQRLDRYYTTTVRDDGASADTSKDVVVLSGSAAASTLGSKYGTKANCVVVLAPTVLPGMAMADAFG